MNMTEDEQLRYENERLRNQLDRVEQVVAAAREFFNNAPKKTDEEIYGFGPMGSPREVSHSWRE